jgi:ammonium transporter, Amt family
VGFFADIKVNAAGHDGLLFGGGVHLLVQQLIAVGAVLGFTFVVSWLLAKGVEATIGLRCTPEEELEGLDLSQHAEAAYSFGELGSIGRI